MVSLAMLTGIVVVAAFPPLGSIFVYDRAAILRGEVWRLLTGNLVHFSAGHLCYDMLALGMAGFVIEYRGYRHFGALFGLAAVAIGGALFLCQPETMFYGGASGLATAAVTFLALRGLSENGLWLKISAVALVTVVVKIIAEFATGQSLLLTASAGELISCPLSHLAGAAAALVIFSFFGSSGRAI
jgi:rhomboid family GlyGly-CTERM serine protease